VSFHDAFPYFADAYGLTIDGTIIAAPGQDPSAGSMADLVQAIRRDHVKAVFAEAQFNDELARTIASETGAEVVSGLYDDTLGDAPLDSYLAIMRSNVDRVVGALGGD
jgi:ABC-type Zn uptake system ZnuABC Zn-binding protein ZnuA